ncbi:4'-phosphopantetheinyl transferase [Streptoalloteichus tenebrarius]|uniref:4'-phosphopantetheinyl transferase n=1 Tax=Streptoalloteichus tenebrarius (strain ATCC 17920 / DSM 40477 / JCM 4838 / CBS 697.72 / NBRC 16177 / NCIMB 11028 / NRRL B-12390 / A12253. 1 / ISP 5477) TaxID=1933 RepID=A0ABT1HTC1_STRSD|nr:4'-phosphopantetheinyl transferase superfamily protein [Streptoalloteichus tenebrarius]MCP2258763.1 4'-phosphopantetheinyl transferase [Streptoalloteichus tenebrarius]BFF02917.1 4'-phosphopantetheinyl transferase superfamily protein [Streptoalloteichus tenebrarius]
MAEHDELPAGECQVWWVRPDPALAGLAGLLDDDERRRYGRFLREGDRWRYVAGHALVRLVLAPLVGRSPSELRFSTVCRHCGAGHGKPRLSPGSDVEFSLSHSGDRVVLAVARGVELGVDVEELGRRTEEGLAEHVLSPAEQAALAALPEDRRHAGFFTYWTRKEAVLKATGHGLAIATQAVELSGPTEPPRLVRWSAEDPLDSPVLLHDLHPGEGYLASVALLTDRPHSVVERDGDPVLRRALAELPAVG